MAEQLTTEQVVRLLRAKNGELENIAKQWFDLPLSTRTKLDEELAYIRLDTALIAGLLANFMENMDASYLLLHAHSENLIERVRALEIHTDYDATLPSDPDG